MIKPSSPFDRFAKQKVFVCSLYCKNINERVVKSHKKVYSHFKIPVNYYYLKSASHGSWMNEIFKTVDADVYLFTDIDCVPITRNSYEKSVNFAIRHNYFTGPAQCTNCINERYHTYAAPSFLCISKKMYNSLGRPNCLNNNISDTGQNITRAAEKKLVRYRLWYPSCFEQVPQEGLWRLSGYGYYGIGTVFGDLQIYHLFQTVRSPQHISLFEKQCDNIINGKFSTDGMYSSTDEYKGVLKIAP